MYIVFKMFLEYFFIWLVSEWWVYFDEWWVNVECMVSEWWVNVECMVCEWWVNVEWNWVSGCEWWVNVGCEWSVNGYVKWMKINDLFGIFWKLLIDFYMYLNKNMYWYFYCFVIFVRIVFFNIIF